MIIIPCKKNNNVVNKIVSVVHLKTQKHRICRYLRRYRNSTGRLDDEGSYEKRQILFTSFRITKDALFLRNKNLHVNWKIYNTRNDCISNRFINSAVAIECFGLNDFGFLKRNTSDNSFLLRAKVRHDLLYRQKCFTMEKNNRSLWAHSLRLHE